MIRLTRINHAPLVLNSDLISHIEETPDTVITLADGQVIRVRETADEIIERICAFRREVFRDSLRCPMGPRLELGPRSEIGNVTPHGR